MCLRFPRKKKIVQLNERLANIIAEDDAILESITNSVELLSNLLPYWKTADRYTKSLIIKMISVELFVDTEKRLYIKENAVFEALRNLNFCEWQSQSQSQSQSLFLSNLEPLEKAYFEQELEALVKNFDKIQQEQIYGFEPRNEYCI